MKLQHSFFFSICFGFTVLFSCTLSSSNIEDLAHSDSTDTVHLLTERIFFFLHEIENTSSLHTVISQNNALNQFFDTKKEAITKAVKDCADMDCLVQALVISNEENQQLSSDLGKSYHTHSAVKDFMRDKIRPSHAYILHSNYSDSALFVEAWKEEVIGLNYIFNAYLLNQELFYPKVDSSKFNVGSQEYLDTVKQVIKTVLNRKKETKDLFFQPLMDISLKILLLNDRDEAVRFYPLSKVNQTAYNYIKNIDWSAYPYSAVLVLGQGPSHYGVALRKKGKRNIRMGVKLYKDKKVPLIVVSGGFVHPYMTKYCEAEEMKRFLIDSLNIPEKAIVMEPHARHTTTNIRNTNRILLNHKVPINKPLIGVTNKGHTDYTTSQRFIKRNMRDIGFIPFTGMERLSDTTFQFYPTISSFQINAIAPLDP